MGWVAYCKPAQGSCGESVAPPRRAAGRIDPGCGVVSLELEMQLAAGLQDQGELRPGAQRRLPAGWGRVKPGDALCARSEIECQAHRADVFDLEVRTAFDEQYGTGREVAVAARVLVLLVLDGAVDLEPWRGSERQPTFACVGGDWLDSTGTSRTPALRRSVGRQRYFETAFTRRSPPAAREGRRRENRLAPTRRSVH